MYVQILLLYFYLLPRQIKKIANSSQNDEENVKLVESVTHNVISHLGKLLGN